jgi:hypothetical protein
VDKLLTGKHWRFLGYPLFFLLPFGVLYWMTPFMGSLTLGADYPEFAVQQQMEILFSIRHGSFPLFMPGFGGGVPSSALILGGIYHPMAYLASLFPGYWNGQALEILTFLRFLSLGLTHLILFLFLRRIRIPGILAFLVSFLTVYNMRMLDMLRVGSPCESFVAYLGLCVAIAWRYLQAPRKFCSGFVIVASYLLVCSGQPQMSYFGFLGAVLVLFTAPFYLRILLPEEVDLSPAALFRNSAGMLVSMGVGCVLSAAFWVPMYFDTLRNLEVRAGKSYIFSLGFSDTVYGNLSEIFNPLHGDIFGSFAGSALVTVVALLPLVALVNQKVERVVLVLWLGCLAVFFYMLGAATPVHYMAWKLLPFVSSFRVPGRISLMMVFPIMLMSAWLFTRPNFQVRISRFVFSLPAYSPLAFVCMIVCFLYVSVPLYGLQVREVHTPAHLCRPSQTVENLFNSLGLLSLGLLGLHGLLVRFRTPIGIALVTVVIAQSTLLLRHGSWIIEKWDMPTGQQMKEEKENSLSFRFQPGEKAWTQDVDRHIVQERQFLEPRLARLCERYLTVSSTDEAYQKLREQRSADCVVVENFEGPSSPQNSDLLPSDRIVLRYSSFNRVVFEATPSHPAFLTLSFPYSSHWSATVNGQKVPIYRANGIEQAVWLTDGGGTVEFRYHSSATTWGIAVSCLFACVLVWYFSAGGRSRAFVGICWVAAPVVWGAFFWIWYQSLYRGENLGTRYEWTPQDRPAAGNLAYGKNTSRSSYHFLYPLLYESARAVDGESRAGSWFASRNEENPWWQVDLGKETRLGKMVVYDPSDLARWLRQGRTDVRSGQDMPPDVASLLSLPVEVWVSSNGTDYEKVHTIERDGSPRVWTVDLAGVSGRYVKLQLVGTGHLALAEVEIFAAPDPQ